MNAPNRAPANRRDAPAQSQAASLQEAAEAYERAMATAKRVEQRLAGYAAWFDAVLPGGYHPAAFITLLSGVLRKDHKLAEAAEGNFQSLMIAATECATLGGTPGKDYHYVPFRDNEGGGGAPVVTGIVDYKLEIQLALNSGFADTIIAECVYKGDHFAWAPTRMRVPEHEIRNFQRHNKDLVAVYAYGELGGRRVGKCVVLWRDEVMKHRDVAPSKKFWDGKWEPDMWRKTAVHVGRRWWGQSPTVRTELIAAQARAIEMGGRMVALDGEDREVLVPPSKAPAAIAPAAAGPPDAIRTVTAEHDTGHGPGDQQDEDPRWAGTNYRPGNGNGGNGGQHAGHPVVAGHAEPAGPAEGKQAAADQGQGQGEVDLDGEVTQSTFGKLNRKFQVIHWTGEGYRDRRRVITEILAAGSNKPPLDLASRRPTEREAQTALAAWPAYADAAEQAGEKLPVKLQRMYDELTRARQQVAAAKAEAKEGVREATGG
jgi:phage RecT family recombinase